MSTDLAARFTTVARHQGDPCVSVLFPVDLRHPDQRRDLVVVRDLVDAARDRLGALGHGRAAPDLLDLDADALWRRAAAQGAGGVAVHRSPGWSSELLLASPVAPAVEVGERPYVLGLAPLAESGVDTHLLTVGADEVALYRVTDGELVRVPVAGLAPSADEALWFERRERHVGAHAGGPGGRGGPSIVHHGGGGIEDDRKARLERYLRTVDDLVVDVVGSTGALLVVGTAAGVAHYERVSRHPWLVGLPLGSPAELRPHELLAGAAEVAAATRAARAERAVARYRSLAGTGRTTADPDELTAAATTGRVDTLLVSRDLVTAEAAAGVWDRPALGHANAALLDVWRTGGTTVVLDPDAAGGVPTLAAVLRY